MLIINRGWFLNSNKALSGCNLHLMHLQIFLPDHDIDKDANPNTD